ncbi:DUF4279 domain-containing protein [Kangiella shandongensis]|uniref:DUF4279 domain-containing protein n=1 Tax=Kangiella shandongensis TaxID=2763258 RepID=UPI001CBED23C|nr:DUF4279 domain-containing protein [Kangiella shandongensis]
MASIFNRNKIVKRKVPRKHQCRVYFALGGDEFVPEEVTKLLGIEPTKVSYKGKSTKGYMIRKTSWIF